MNEIKLQKLELRHLEGSTHVTLMNRGQFQTVRVEYELSKDEEFFFNGDVNELKLQCNYYNVKLSDNRSEVR